MLPTPEVDSQQFSGGGDSQGGLRMSVVICTHNRAALLPQALDSLLCQTLDRRQYEIAVVDNRSTDETGSVVAEYQARHSLCALRLLYEAELGLGHARNKGWRCAKGTYVAFMDDDAKADPHWLEQALEVFERSRPTPVAVGGQILPFYPFPKPAWYKDEYEVRSWGGVPRRLCSGESFSGSNMIVSKAVLQQLDGFDTRVGMRGDYMSVGEETLFFQKVWSLFGEEAMVMYSPHLIVYHRVGKHKLRTSYHLSRWFVSGQVASRLNAAGTWRERLHQLRAGLAAIRALSREAITQWRQCSDHRAWTIEQLGPIALEVGRLLAGLGLCLPVKRAKV